MKFTTQRIKCDTSNALYKRQKTVNCHLKFSNQCYRDFCHLTYCSSLQCAVHPLKCAAYWRSGCIAHSFVTSITTRHIWLKRRGRSLTTGSLIGRSLIKQWRPRLRSYIQQEGGHFGHRL